MGYYRLLPAVAAATRLFRTPAAAQDLRGYCAKVGDDDHVQPVPDALLRNARRMFDFSVDTADSEYLVGPLC